jgi:hypothetical protein
METPTKRPVHLEVEMLLAGMDFPANKRAIVQNAKEQDAPKWLYMLLESIPDTVYDSPAEVGREAQNFADNM